MAAATAQARPVDDGGWTVRNVLALIPLLLIIEVMTVQFSMVGIALPTIAEHFATTQVAWTYTAAAISAGALSPVFGKLADVHGKKNILLVISVLGTLGYAVSAFAPTFGVFLVGRALAGVLVCAVFVGFSLIRDVFPMRIVPTASGLATAGTAVIAALGPVAAGWTLGIGDGITATFAFLAVAAAVSTVALLLLTPETPARAAVSIDYLGAVLVAAGTALLLSGLSQGQSAGWGAPSVLGALVVGLSLLVAWIAHSLRARFPLVDLRFFVRGSMAGIAGSALFVAGGVSMIGVVLPIIALTPAEAGLGYGLGLTPSQFSLFIIPQLVLSMVGGVVAGRVVRWVRPVVPYVVALVCLTAGFAGLAFFNDTLGEVLVFAMLEGFGQGLALSSKALLIFRAVPVDRQAQMAGTDGVLGGLASAAVPVLLYLVLNAHVVSLGAAAGYTEDGVRGGVLLLAGTIALGLAVAVALLLRRRPDEEAAALASDLALREAGTDEAALAGALADTPVVQVAAAATVVPAAEPLR